MNNRDAFPAVPEAEKFQVKTLAASVSGEGPRPGS